jgi:hypothetical protein
MVLWLRLWRWLPVATPAYGAALATVLLGIGAVCSLQWACRAWGASPAATALASAVFAFSPVAWEQASHAEAFAMNAMFGGCILALSAPDPAPGLLPRGLARIVVLGLVAGLAIGGHQTIVLLAPVGLYAAVRAIRRARRPGLAAAIGLGALLAGFALPNLQIYVLARSGDFRTQPMWIEGSTLSAVVSHLRREAYGTFSLAPASLAVPRHPVLSVGRFTLATGVHLLGLPVVVVAAIALWMRDLRRPSRSVMPAGSTLALAGSYLLAGPGFAALMNIATEGAGLRVAERFDLLPEVVLCLAAAISLDRIAPRLGAGSPLALPLTASVALVAAVVALPAVRENRRPDVASYLENVLATAPQGAVIVASGDECWGAFLYARYAERRRADLVFINPGLVPQRWYRKEALALTGVSFETPDRGPIGPRTTLGRLLQTGRPVFYTDWPDPKLAGTPHDSFGPLMRILPEGEPRPTIDAVLAANRAAFAAYQIDPAPPSDPTAWGRPLYEAYARAWVELARRLASSGRDAEAASCIDRALALAPWTFTPEPRTG